MLDPVEPSENCIKLLVSNRSAFQSLFDPLHSLRQCEVLLLKSFEISRHFLDGCFKSSNPIQHLGDFRFKRFLHAQHVLDSPFKLPVVFLEVPVVFGEMCSDLFKLPVVFDQMFVDLLELAIVA
jgi:hypothetical protein